MPGSKLACHTSWMSSTILVIHKNTSFDHLKAKKSKFWPFSLPNPMARFFVCTGISLTMQKWDSYQPFRKWKWSNFDLQVVFNIYVVDLQVWSHFGSRNLRNLTFFVNFCENRSKMGIHHPVRWGQFWANEAKNWNSVKRTQK